MRILAIDTATWWGSAALVEVGSGEPRVVAEIGALVRDTHAERVLGWIERLLAEAGWSRESLDAFAATRGPGSFTGIRVGLGIVRGLGLASGRPCHGVTTLEALVEAHGPAERPRWPVLDAGRGGLYAARCDGVSSPPRTWQQPWLTRAEDLLAEPGAERCLLIPGFGTRLDVASGQSTRLAPCPRGVAGAAGRIVARRVGLDPGPSATPLAPLYVRPPDVRIRPAR